MQRFSRETRDNNDSVRRIISQQPTRNNGSNKVIDDFDIEHARINGHSAQSRTVEIISDQGDFHTLARLEATGEYDKLMKEWTVYFMERDQSSLCSVRNLNGLEIRVGDLYSVRFTHDVHNVQVSIHNVENEGEKSVSFTIGNELMLLGKFIGYPEERSPHSDEDTVYQGDLPNLLTMLESEEMVGSSISFGCVVFKDYVLKDLGRVSEEEKSNWETFE
jgi:hypothetical protein